VQSILGVVLVSFAAFFGTMIDNFFAFAAQLTVTERSRYRRVSWAHVYGVATLILLSGALGSILAPIPLRWIGVLAIAPFAFAVHSWRHRSSPRQQFRRGGITTFAITVSLGGDNLAVWIPLFRANGVGHAFYSVATFGVLEIVFLLCARAIASHPRVVRWGTEHAGTFMPLLYAILGIVILFECHTI
jgi:cadmium resistance protein CadD (predicted permease)